MDLKNLADRVHHEKTSKTTTPTTRAELSKEIFNFNQKISEANLSQWRREWQRKQLQDLKNILIELNKNDTKNQINEAVDDCRKILEKYPDRHCLIANFEMGNDTKNLSTVVNEVRKISKDVAVMLFSVDRETDKFVCLANVSDVSRLESLPFLSNRNVCLIVLFFKVQVKDKHLKANEWVSKVIAEANGKGGGKDTQAQATNCDSKQLDHCVKIAEEFALLKLNSTQ